MNPYSTKKISPSLVREILGHLANLDYGSVEIYVNNHDVVQITKRKIKKLNNQQKGLDKTLNSL